VNLPQNPYFTARTTRVSGDPSPGMAALADALLLVTASPELDEALRIAHNFTASNARLRTRHSALRQTAGALREQLDLIEGQLGEAA
jgi:hypothetical protein